MSAKKTEKSAIKVIALVSRPHEFKSVFDQLKARNILVFTAPSVEAATKVLESGVVDFCLVSVDHPKIDIYAWPQEVENKLKIPVIAVSELRDKQSMWRLTKVRVKNILYSKATAPSIFARIELMRKLSLANKASQSLEVQRSLVLDSQKREGGSRAARKARQLKERFTEKVVQKKSLNLFDAWKKPMGSVTLTEAKYKFIGHNAEEDTPKEKVKRHKEFMELFAKSAEESEVRVDLSALENGSVEVDDSEEGAVPSRFDYSALEEAKFERVDDSVEEIFDFQSKTSDDLEGVEGFKHEGVAAEDTQKIILHCLRTVISEFCNPNEFTKEATEYSNSMVISIKSKSLVGTFIIAEQFTNANLSELQTRLYEYLRNFGFDWTQEEIAVEILRDLKVPSEVVNSGVYVSGVGEEGEMAFSYYQEAVDLPQLTLPEDMKYYVDPKCLVKNTNVNFDIYIHLRVNDKDIQYVKLGSDISEKQIQKLKSAAAVPWVPRQQLSNLTEYILLQRLLRMIRGPDDEELQEVEELLKIS